MKTLKGKTVKNTPKTRRRNVNPTERQRLLASKLVENVGTAKKTQGQLLKESNYSDAMVKNPKKAIQTVGVQQLLKDSDVLTGLKKLRQMCILRLEQTLPTADTTQTKGVLDTLTKSIQLMEGKSTDNVAHVFTFTEE